METPDIRRLARQIALEIDASRDEREDIFAGLPVDVVDRYLNGTASEAERSQIEAAAERNPALRRALAALNATGSTSDVQAEPIPDVPAPVFLNVRDPQEPPPGQKWDQVATELKAYRDAQQAAWGGIEDATLARYVAGESNVGERLRVETALGRNPELHEAVEQVRSVLRTREPTTWPTAAFKRVTKVIDMLREHAPRSLRPLATQPVPLWALAASILLLIVTGGFAVATLQKNQGHVIGVGGMSLTLQSDSEEIRNMLADMLDDQVRVRADVDSTLTNFEKTLEKDQKKLEDFYRELSQNVNKAFEELAVEKRQNEERFATAKNMKELIDRLLMATTVVSDKVELAEQRIMSLDSLVAKSGSQLQELAQELAMTRKDEPMPMVPGNMKNETLNLRAQLAQAVSPPPLLDISGGPGVERCPTPEQPLGPFGMAPRTGPLRNLVHAQTARVERFYLEPGVLQCQAPMDKGLLLRRVGQGVTREEIEELLGRQDRLLGGSIGEKERLRQEIEDLQGQMRREENEKVREDGKNKIEPLSDRSRVYFVGSELDAATFRLRPHGRLHLFTFRLSGNQGETGSSVEIDFIEYRKLVPPRDRLKCTEGVPHSFQIHEGDKSTVYLVCVFGDNRPDIDGFEAKLRSAMSDANAKSLSEAVRIAERVVRQQGGDPTTIELHQMEETPHLATVPESSNGLPPLDGAPLDGAPFPQPEPTAMPQR